MKRFAIPSFIHLACLCGVLAFGLPTAKAQSARGNSSRECAICHIRWVDALVRTDDQSKSMDKVLERQAGSGDMCLSCHDGSVADSRFKVWSTSHHTTGQVPPPNIHIPTDRFPLDSEGRMTCATCHTAHAVAESSDIRTVVFLRQPNVDSSICLACHGENAQKNEFQHPLGAMDKAVPQVILDAGGKTSEDGHGMICQTCHEPHGARNDWMLVLPPSELCIACHADKDTTLDSKRGIPFHKMGQTFSGFNAPASLLDANASFGPDGELSCLSCHRLHDASGASPLLIRKNQNSSLCLECHEREQSLSGSMHDFRQGKANQKKDDDENLDDTGLCSMCHLVHGWARDLSPKIPSHRAGCAECHHEGAADDPDPSFAASHPVGCKLPEGQTTFLPMDQETGTIGCVTCHDPHRAISDAQGNPQIPSPPSFLRLPGSQLCLECHGKKMAALSGVHDPKSFSETELSSHSVDADEGACRVCHTAHNAKGSHLWAQKPSVSEGDTLSGLCQACHSGHAIGPAETQHPDVTSEGLKGLKKHEVNAESRTGCGACHDPHASPEQLAQLKQEPDRVCNTCHDQSRTIKGSVHDPNTADWSKEVGFASQSLCVDCHPVHSPQEEGRLWKALGGRSNEPQLCTVCHSPHTPGMAVTTPHMGLSMMSDPNGVSTQVLMKSHDSIRCSTCHNIHQEGTSAWMLKASIQDSTLCLTCHAEMARVLSTDHDLRVSGSEVKNVRNERPQESGPCGVCHKIHATPSAPGVWARSSTVRQDFGRHQCTDCHSIGQNAEGHIPDFAGHPDLPLMNLSAAMPTFTSKGELSVTGGITCKTCHDPHLAPSELPPRNHKFLRPGTQQTLCVTCHGREGLWRYLYYHKEKRTP